MGPLMATAAEATDMLRVGRSAVYRLIAAGSGSRSRSAARSAHRSPRSPTSRPRVRRRVCGGRSGSEVVIVWRRSRKRPDGKWRARYRPVPGGRQIARHFRRKIDAERWLTEQQSRVNRGIGRPRIGPDRGQRVGGETWLASKKTLKGRTYTSYESVWRTLVKPRWGDTRLDRVTHGEVVRWVAELSERGLSPSRITQALLCLKQVLALAVMDGRLARNAAEHVKPPRPRRLSRGFSLMSRCMTSQSVWPISGLCLNCRLHRPALGRATRPTRKAHRS